MEERKTERPVAIKIEGDGNIVEESEFTGYKNAIDSKGDKNRFRKNIFNPRKKRIISIIAIIEGLIVVLIVKSFSHFLS